MQPLAFLPSLATLPCAALVVLGAAPLALVILAGVLGDDGLHLRAAAAKLSAKLLTVADHALSRALALVSIAVLFGCAAAFAGCAARAAPIGDGARDASADDVNGVVDDSCARDELSDGMPCSFSATGFEQAEEFFPAAKLWSDGAEKHRFVKLPEGGVIDATDIDHWRFPKGTKLWKDITVEGVRMETRMLEKVGDDDETGWRMGSYVWTGDSAVLATAGADVNGWHVPASSDCLQCHGNEPGRVLGYSAVQLSKDDQLAQLVAAHKVAPAPASMHASVYSWAPVARDAMLYVHGNCGHCHQEGGIGTWGDIGQKLRIGYNDKDAAHTDAYTTTVNVGLGMGAIDDATTMRVKPGDPDHSGVFVRMQHRGDWLQMPMLGSDVVDTNGNDVVAAWIRSL